MRKVLSWPWRRRRALGLALLVVFVLLNVLAYRHAHGMTHFVKGGDWHGRKPESLSLGRRLGVLLGGISLPRPQAKGVPADLELDYQTHTFAGQDGELEAWYVPCPRERGVVLLFHGYNSCKARLLPEARAFLDLGYACFLVDFRGSGGSAGDRTTIGFAEADDVDRAASYVRQRWPGRPVILFGQSMGSAAVLRAVGVLGTRADALVLECPFDRLLTAVSVRFRVLGAPAFPAAHLMVFWGGQQLGFNGFRHNPVEYARRVSCPVLLLHGKADGRVRRGEVEAIYRNLGGEKKLHLFAGVGHESYVGRSAKEWQGQVADFLHGLPGGA
jgi:alpha-beta hydrolase superfamily lysophospholipase